MTSVLHREAGTTLVELIVGLAFASILAVMLHQFSRSMLHGVGVLEAASEAEEAVRVALHVITRDLRDAGFSGDGSLGNGVRSARRDGIDVVADRNSDGDTQDANERVGYSIDAATHTLRRSTGLAPPQPFLPSLTANGVSFRYYDDAGLPLEINPPEDSACARIRRIEVTLETELANPDPAAMPIRVAHSAAIALRNE